MEKYEIAPTTYTLSEKPFGAAFKIVMGMVGLRGF